MGIGALAALAHRLISGAWLAPQAYWTYSGAPVTNPLIVVLYVWLVDGFGEEIGWRGFLTEELLRGHSVKKTALLVVVRLDVADSANEKGTGAVRGGVRELVVSMRSV